MLLKSAWIGLAHVRPLSKDNVLGPSRAGAFVHVLAKASNEEQYKAMAIDALAQMELAVISFEDVALASDYALEGRISPEIEEILSSLSSDDPVQFSSFDAYGRSDG